MELYNMKTAVEWLEEKLIEAGLQFTKGEALEIEQAKEMEKQQTIEAYISGRDNVINRNNILPLQYYKETFNK
jgi:hypothetical protein